MNSGYIMVDITGLDVSGAEAQTIPGIYERFERAVASNKPICAFGADNDGDKISPAFIVVTEGAGFGFTLGSFTAVVTSDDKVTPAEG